jgi:pilus assembly protein CpaB
MKILPVIVGLLAGVVGIVLLVVYMRRFEQEVSGGPRIGLLVAASPIVRGKPIAADMLGTREVPLAYVDERTIRATDKDKIVGLQATTNIPVQQTIAWTDVIAMNDSQRDLSSLVQPGNRAMPLRVTFSEQVSFIRPGDFVDIIALNGDGREASVLLQRVLVLASGSETSNDKQTDRRTARGSLLTVSVSLQEGQLLALAMAKGSLTVVIRSPQDQTIAETPPDLSSATLNDSTKRETIGTRRRPAAPTKLQTEPAAR